MTMHKSVARPGHESIRLTNRTRNLPTVIIVGPGSDQVGGMASVVEQTVHLGYDDRYQVELLPFTLCSTPRESVVHRLIRHLGQSLRLRKRIRQSRAAIVHLHTCSGATFYRSVADMLLVKSLGCAVVLHIHGAAFDEFYANASRLKQGLITRALTAADRVVALSAGWRDKLQTMAPESSIVVVENAVECAVHVAKTGERDVCRFVLLSRMDTWKGIDDLLDACTTLLTTCSKFEIILAGPEGTAGDAKTLERKISSRGLSENVKYIGCVRGDEKTALLNRADVYIQPSHHEGMPIAILEALAHGLPIIATRVGAIPEVIVQEQQGLIVAPHKPELLADAMLRMVREEESRAAMGTEALKLFEKRFSLARFDQDLTRLYDGITRATLRAKQPSVGGEHLAPTPAI